MRKALLIILFTASLGAQRPGAGGSVVGASSSSGSGSGGSLCSATGGATNTLVSACSPAPTAYAAGMSVYLKVDACPMTPGPTTINLNSLGAKNVYQNGVPLNAVVCVLDPGVGTGAIYSLTYDGTRFNLPAATTYSAAYNAIPDATVGTATQGQLLSSTSPTNPSVDSTGVQITTNEADSASGGSSLGYLVGLAQTLTSSDSSTVPWHFVLGIQAAANAVSNVSQPAREVDGVYAVAASAEPNPILNLQGLYGKADNLTADVTGYASGVSGYAQNTSPAALTGKLTGGYFYVPLSTSGGTNLGSALTASVLAGDTYCLNSTSCAGVWVTPVVCGTTSGDCVAIYAQGATYPSLYAEGWTVQQGATFATLTARGVSWENGSTDYCTDCTVTSGIDDTCTGGGGGATVNRTGGVNHCSI